jgi:hypothetical protein
MKPSRTKPWQANMRRKKADRDDSELIPHWYLRTFEAIQHIDGGLRKAELELGQAMDLEALDPRVRVELHGVLDGLHAVKGRLALVTMAVTDIVYRSPSQTA